VKCWTDSVHRGAEHWRATAEKIVKDLGATAEFDAKPANVHHKGTHLMGTSSDNSVIDANMRYHHYDAIGTKLRSLSNRQVQQAAAAARLLRHASEDKLRANTPTGGDLRGFRAAFLVNSSDHRPSLDADMDIVRSADSAAYAHFVNNR
jgi:hypothetical protein